MTETFTLAHFSDVHMSPIPGVAWQYWNAKRLFGYLNWQRSRRHVHSVAVADRLIADALALRSDHIAITGDLVNLGLPAEHEAALVWLRERRAAGQGHGHTGQPRHLFEHARRSRRRPVGGLYGVRRGHAGLPVRQARRTAGTRRSEFGRRNSAVRCERPVGTASARDRAGAVGRTRRRRRNSRGAHSPSAVGQSRHADDAVSKTRPI